MDVIKVCMKYVGGEVETFETSDSEVERIKFMKDRILIFGRDPSEGKKKCKIILISNLLNFEILPCNEEELMAQFR